MIVHMGGWEERREGEIERRMEKRQNGVEKLAVVCLGGYQPPSSPYSPSVWHTYASI